MVQTKPKTIQNIEKSVATAWINHLCLRHPASSDRNTGYAKKISDIEEDGLDAVPLLAALEASLDTLVQDPIWWLPGSIDVSQIYPHFLPGYHPLCGAFMAPSNEHERRTNFAVVLAALSRWDVDISDVLRACGCSEKCSIPISIQIQQAAKALVKIPSTKAFLHLVDAIVLSSARPFLQSKQELLYNLLTFSRIRLDKYPKSVCDLFQNEVAFKHLLQSLHKEKQLITSEPTSLLEHFCKALNLEIDLTLDMCYRSEHVATSVLMFCFSSLDSTFSPHRQLPSDSARLSTSALKRVNAAVTSSNSTMSSPQEITHFHNAMQKFQDAFSDWHFMLQSQAIDLPLHGQFVETVQQCQRESDSDVPETCAFFTLELFVQLYGLRATPVDRTDAASLGRHECKLSRLIRQVHSNLADRRIFAGPLLESPSDELLHSQQLVQICTRKLYQHFIRPHESVASCVRRVFVPWLVHLSQYMHALACTTDDDSVPLMRSFSASSSGIGAGTSLRGRAMSMNPTMLQRPSLRSGSWAYPAEPSGLAPRNLSASFCYNPMSYPANPTTLSYNSPPNMQLKNSSVSNEYNGINRARNLNVGDSMRGSSENIPNSTHEQISPGKFGLNMICATQTPDSLDEHFKDKDEFKLEYPPICSEELRTRPELVAACVHELMRSRESLATAFCAFGSKEYMYNDPTPVDYFQGSSPVNTPRPRLDESDPKRTMRPDSITSRSRSGTGPECSIGSNSPGREKPGSPIGRVYEIDQWANRDAYFEPRAPRRYSAASSCGEVVGSDVWSSQKGEASAQEDDVCTEPDSNSSRGGSDQSLTISDSSTHGLSGYDNDQIYGAKTPFSPHAEDVESGTLDSTHHARSKQISPIPQVSPKKASMIDTHTRSSPLRLSQQVAPKMPVRTSDSNVPIQDAARVDALYPGDASTNRRFQNCVNLVRQRSLSDAPSPTAGSDLHSHHRVGQKKGPARRSFAQMAASRRAQLSHVRSSPSPERNIAPGASSAPTQLQSNFQNIRMRANKNPTLFFPSSTMADMSASMPSLDSWSGKLGPPGQTPRRLAHANAASAGARGPVPEIANNSPPKTADKGVLNERSSSTSSGPCKPPLPPASLGSNGSRRSSAGIAVGDFGNYATGHTLSQARTSVTTDSSDATNKQVGSVASNPSKLQRATSFDRSNSMQAAPAMAPLRLSASGAALRRVRSYSASANSPSPIDMNTSPIPEVQRVRLDSAQESFPPHAFVSAQASACARKRRALLRLGGSPLREETSVSTDDATDEPRFQRRNSMSLYHQRQRNRLRRFGSRANPLLSRSLSVDMSDMGAAYPVMRQTSWHSCDISSDASGLQDGEEGYIPQWQAGNRSQFGSIDTSKQWPTSADPSRMILWSPAHRSPSHSLSTLEASEALPSSDKLANALVGAISKLPHQELDKSAASAAVQGAVPETISSTSDSASGYSEAPTAQESSISSANSNTTELPKTTLLAYEGEDSQRSCSDLAKATLGATVLNRGRQTDGILARTGFVEPRQSSTRFPCQSMGSENDRSRASMDDSVFSVQDDDYVPVNATDEWKSGFRHQLLSCQRRRCVADLRSCRAIINKRCNNIQSSWQSTQNCHIQLDSILKLCKSSKVIPHYANNGQVERAFVVAGSQSLRAKLKFADLLRTYPTRSPNYLKASPDSPSMSNVDSPEYFNREYALGSKDNKGQQRDDAELCAMYLVGSPTNKENIPRHLSALCLEGQSTQQRPLSVGSQASQTKMRCNSRADPSTTLKFADFLHLIVHVILQSFQRLHKFSTDETVESQIAAIADHTTNVIESMRISAIELLISEQTT